MSEVITTVDEKLNSKIQKAEVVEEVLDNEISEPQSEPERASAEPESVYDNGADTDSSGEPPSAEKDDFGNEVVPQKVYTEEEVNKMMRDRFNRSAANQAPPEPPKSEAPKEEASEDWESTLENFVENTVQKLTVKQQQAQREQQERQVQTEFETKMLNGMSKYKDFQDIVGKAKISDAMVRSTFQMKDPAAFIYAASKTQPKELERISSINDPFSQALEMGKLEERMRKVRAGTTTPKPIGQVKGDVQNSAASKRGSVDDNIRRDALKKLQGRRF